MSTISHRPKTGAFAMLSLTAWLAPSIAAAHSVFVHAAMSEAAAISSQNLYDFTKDALGVDMTATIPKFQYDASTQTLIDWIEQGSRDEDKPAYPRTENHFYTPVPRSRWTRRLADSPRDTATMDSFKWASAASENTETWQKARGYQFGGHTRG